MKGGEAPTSLALLTLCRYGLQCILNLVQEQINCCYVVLFLPPSLFLAQV